MTNVITVDFAQRKAPKTHVDHNATQKALELSLKALMFSIIDRCNSVLSELDNFQDGNEGLLSFIEFFNEAIKHNLQCIEDAQHRLGDISYRMDLLTEDIERLHLGEIYGFLYE